MDFGFPNWFAPIATPAEKSASMAPAMNDVFIQLRIVSYAPFSFASAAGRAIRMPLQSSLIRIELAGFADEYFASAGPISRFESFGRKG